MRHGSGLRLPKLSSEQQFLDRLMRLYHHTRYPHRRYLSSRPEAIRELETDELLQVRAEISARRVYVIFRTLGLGHLCVTDASNRVIGVITRKDIAKAQKEHKDSEIDPKTPKDSPEYENLQSFGLRSLSSRWSFKDRSPRDVLYSLP